MDQLSRLLPSTREPGCASVRHRRQQVIAKDQTPWRGRKGTMAGLQALYSWPMDGKQDRTMTGSLQAHCYHCEKMCTMPSRLQPAGKCFFLEHTHGEHSKHYNHTNRLREEEDNQREKRLQRNHHDVIFHMPLVHRHHTTTPSSCPPVHMPLTC